MSLPAHRLGIADHEPAPTRPRVRPTPTPAAPPATSPSLPSRRRARRRNTSAFWIFTALVVTAMVVGIVSISALLVRASFHVDELRARITEATHVQQDLLQDVAALSSPSRIHRWARQQGFVVPDGVVILSVPGARA